MRLFAAAVLLLAAGCAGSAESVADKFVDYYFVEMDQGRALPLASEIAHDMLERELRDVAGIRKEMRFAPAESRPEVYYKRTSERTAGDRHVFTYDLTLKLKQDTTRKSAQVAVRRMGSDWKVVFYQVGDGEAPARPSR